MDVVLQSSIYVESILHGGKRDNALQYLNSKAHTCQTGAQAHPE